MFSTLTDPDLQQFIRTLPKTETHLHIEGALPMELLRSLDPERFAADPEPWAQDYRYESFEAFNDFLLGHALLWFTTPERYHQAARVLFQNHLEQGVRYVETSFHSGAAVLNNFDPQEAIAAILEAAPPGLEVRVWMGLLRFEEDPQVRQLLDQCHRWEQLSGIDLHGVELHPIKDWTVELWERTAAEGKRNKAHAGEFGGAEYVSDALDKLKVKRIQHGVRAVEDPEVVQRLLGEEITLDICPISNLKLAPSVPTMTAHPIRPLFDAGVRCTVSTDDPFSFGNTLLDEYAQLATQLNFSKAELIEIARNGFRVADLPESERERHFTDLNQRAAGLSTPT